MRQKIKSGDGLRDKLISNTIYLFVDWFALSIIGFFFWFIAGKFLLPVEYGIVSTSVNLALLVGGASLLGLHSTIWKLIPEFLGRHEHNKIYALINFSMKVILISNIVLIALIFIFSSFVSSVLKIPVNVVLISSLALFSYSVSLQFRYVLYSFQEMGKLTFTDILGQIAKIAISFALILFGFRYFGPLIGFLMSNILTILIRIRHIPLKRVETKINRKLVLFRYAIPAFIISISWLVFTNGQYLLISALKGPGITGIYTVAMVLTSYLVVIPTTLNSALLPIISRLSIDSNSNDRQSRLIGLVLRYTLLITIPLAILLVFFSRNAILIFSRVEYISASQFLPLLSFASVTYGISGIFLDNIYAIGKTIVNRNIVIVGTIIFLISSITLINLFSALGSALAYTVSSIALALMSYLYLRKKIKLRLPFKEIGKLTLSAIISFGSLWLMLGVVQKFEIRILFAMISSLTYLILLLPMKFYTTVDIKILDFFADRLPFINKVLTGLKRLLETFV